MHLPRGPRHPRFARAVTRLVNSLPEPVCEPLAVGAMFVSIWSLTGGYVVSRGVHSAANTVRSFLGRRKPSRFDVLHTKKYLHLLHEQEERLH